jgi:hypothetical protein
MAKGISINFLADVKDFLRGTKDVEEELDDVADSLDDVAKDGDQATEKLEKSFKDLAKAAKSSGDDIEKGIGQGTKRGTQQAEAATDVYKKEAIANVSEVTSSFTGSWESAADAVQGTLGGVVADLGPAGAAIGAAGAIGIGLLTQAIIQAEEAAKETTARIGELGLEMIEAGSDGAVPLETVIDNLKEIITNSEDATKKFQDIARASKFLGTQIEQVTLAYAGNEQALESQLKATEDLIETAQKEADLASENGSRFGAISAAKLSSLEAQQKELQKIQEETERAAEIEQAWLASGGAEAVAKAEAINQIDAAYDEAVFGVGNFLNAETGIYDLDAFAASIEERERLLLEYQTALANSGLTTEQKAALNEYGVEQANAILKGLADPGVSQKTKDTIKKGLSEASKEGSGVAQEEIKKAFKDPIEAKVEAKADTAMAQRDLDNLIKARTAIIRVDFQDRYGRRAY